MLIKRQNGFRYTLRIQFVKLLSRDFPLAFVFVAEFWKIDFLQKPKLRVPDGWWYFFPWRSSNFHLVPLFSWVCHIQALLCCVSMPFQRLNIFEKFQMTQKFLLFFKSKPTNEIFATHKTFFGDLAKIQMALKCVLPVKKWRHTHQNDRNDLLDKNKSIQKRIFRLIGM